MTEQCGADAPDDVDEYNRDERVETIYQGWGAREMAERIVDLEDELGEEREDGVCTGMHADVAEAWAEIERQAAELRRLEGDCIGLSEALDEARATNAELVKDARDGAHWERVADRMRGEIFRLRSESGRYRLAWTSARSRVKRARWAGVSDLRFTRNMWADAVRDLARYRLAWLSARRRAADEANLGMEALDHVRADRDRWRSGHETAEAQLVYVRRENARLRALLDERESTHAPRLEYAGTDEDGEVWRLESRT